MRNTLGERRDPLTMPLSSAFEGHGRSRGGFTLLELLVAMAILAIIITPLTFAFLTGMQNTRKSEQLIGESRSAQQIASLWTRDVQNVDPGGVNTQATCEADDPSSEPEETLVTFSWGTSSTAPTEESVTWVVVGTGVNAKILRRSCETGSLVREQVVADSFGLSNEEPSQVVRGPDPGDPRQFCPADSAGIGRTCTIVVDGAYSYSLEVARRVPDMEDFDAPLTPPGAPKDLSVVPRNTSTLR